MSQRNSALEGLDKLLKVALAIMMALLVVDVTWQILTRFILPQPSSFTEEIARFLLIWISLLGGAYAYRLHSHLGFDLIVRNMAPARATLVYRFTCVLVMIFAVLVLIVGGGNLVAITWSLSQNSPVLNLPMAIVYSVLPISGLIFIIYAVNFFMTASEVTQNLAMSPEELEEQDND